MRDLIVEPASKWVAKQLRIRFGAVQQHVSRESAKVGWPEVKKTRGESIGFVVDMGQKLIPDSMACLPLKVIGRRHLSCRLFVGA